MADYKPQLYKRVSDEIEDLNELELENSDDSLELIFTSKFKIPELVLSSHSRKDGGYTEIDISRDNRFGAYYGGDGSPVYKKAKVVNVHIPFQGNPEYLEIEPSTSNRMPVRGRIVGNEIVVEFTFFPDVDSSEQLKREIDQDVGTIKRYVGFMNKDITEFNGQLSGLIRRGLKTRRENLRREKEIIHGLDIPEREEACPGVGFVKPINKIEVRIQNTPSIQDPVLDDSIYQGITEQVNSLGINLERCKSHVRSLDEESLRDTFFMALNSTYKGLVSTEAFNRSGKTDILIRHQENNLYISEFKIWSDYSYFSEGITQLLNNLTWRDAKCSYVIFSRNVNFNNVLTKAQELVSTHPRFFRMVGKLSDGCIKFEFRGNDTSDKKITLTLHLFNIY
jgi:hypothetical protein